MMGKPINFKSIREVIERYSKRESSSDVASLQVRENPISKIPSNVEQVIEENSPVNAGKERSSSRSKENNDS